MAYKKIVFNLQLFNEKKQYFGNLFGAAPKFQQKGELK